MAEEVKSVGQLLWNMASRTVQVQARTLNHYGHLWGRFIKGEVSATSAPVDSVRFASEETARYARDLMVLSLSYYDTLLDLGRNYNDALFSRVFAEESVSDAEHLTTSTATPAESGAHRVELTVSGRAGEVAIGSFVLENKGADPTDVSFLVSDFSAVGDAENFRGHLMFSPERLTLASREERLVTVRLPLKEDHFVSGHRYSATILVRGYDNLELQLNVVVEDSSVTAKSMSNGLRAIGAEPAA